MPIARSARSEGGIDKYIFASDNTAGICPEAWAALADANADHVPAYGDDLWTAKASDRIREVFEADCEVFFCFNGTAANSMSLASLCESYHSIICHERAHRGRGIRPVTLPLARGTGDHPQRDPARRRRYDHPG